MGWNSGYTAMEAAIIAAYDAGNLTAEALDKIMEPYKGTDCDSGGSRDLKTFDGFGVKEVICKIMKPMEYKEAMGNPRMYADFEKIKISTWNAQTGSLVRMKKRRKFSIAYGEICGKFGKTQ